jgi:biopolymer transport protein TolQ
MQQSAIALVLQASLFVKVILLILLFFSITSWAIIVYKYDSFSEASRQSQVFLAAFGSGRPTQEILKTARSLPASPLAKLFQAIQSSLSALSRDRVERVLKRHEAMEVERLHGYLTFLAITGSTTPFIGLLGTVWGIINAFQGIGATGSASLAVVAPGIAEALVTTAAGLAAAIPAVMAYNGYLSWARRIVLQMEDFSDQLKDSLVREVA